MALLFCGIGPQVRRFTTLRASLLLAPPRPPPRPRSLEIAVNLPKLLFFALGPSPELSRLSPGRSRDGSSLRPASEALREAAWRRSRQPLGRQKSTIFLQFLKVFAYSRISLLDCLRTLRRAPWSSLGGPPGEPRGVKTDLCWSSEDAPDFPNYFLRPSWSVF